MKSSLTSCNSHHICVNISSDTEELGSDIFTTCPVSLLKWWCHGFTDPKKWTILTSFPNLKNTLIDSM